MSPVFRKEQRHLSADERDQLGSGVCRVGFGLSACGGLPGGTFARFKLAGGAEHAPDESAAVLGFYVGAARDC